MRTLSGIGMLLAVAAAYALSVAPPSSAQEAKYFKLLHVETKKVLAVADDSDEAEARAILGKDEARQARQWKLVKDGEYYKLVNRKSGMVLDVFGDQVDEGAPIIQWNDKPEGNDNQRWSWVGEGKQRRLKAKHSGLVMDVDGEGKLLQKKADEKVKAQLWEMVEVKD